MYFLCSFVLAILFYVEPVKAADCKTQAFYTDSYNQWMLEDGTICTPPDGGQSKTGGLGLKPGDRLAGIYADDNPFEPLREEREFMGAPFSRESMELWAKESPRGRAFFWPPEAKPNHDANELRFDLSDELHCDNEAFFIRSLSLWMMADGRVCHDLYYRSYNLEKRAGRLIYEDEKYMSGGGLPIFPGDRILSIREEGVGEISLTQASINAFGLSLNAGEITLQRNGKPQVISLSRDERLRYALETLQKSMRFLFEQSTWKQQSIARDALGDVAGIGLVFQRRPSGSISETNRFAYELDPEIYPCPACDAGLLPFDQVLEVNGVVVDQVKENDAAKKINSWLANHDSVELLVVSPLRRPGDSDDDFFLHLSGPDFNQQPGEFDAPRTLHISKDILWRRSQSTIFWDTKKASIQVQDRLLALDNDIAEWQNLFESYRWDSASLWREVEESKEKWDEPAKIFASMLNLREDINNILPEDRLGLSDYSCLLGGDTLMGLVDKELVARQQEVCTKVLQEGARRARQQMTRPLD